MSKSKPPKKKSNNKQKKMKVTFTPNTQVMFGLHDTGPDGKTRWCCCDKYWVVVTGCPIHGSVGRNPDYYRGR